MVAIIGGGLSGLVAAKVLEENNIDFRLFEKSDSIGGRVKSDHENGFIFDHGFQVLLNSYPQIKKHINIKELQAKSFAPGATIYQAPGKVMKIGDPTRRPGDLVTTALAPIGSILDKLNILRLRSKEGQSSKSAKHLLINMGFSEKIIQSFFKPFFSGVFLEKELKTQSDYFLYLYRRFSEGLATLPTDGMQALPSLLARNFIDKIQLNSKVEKVNKESDHYLVYVNDENHKFKQVIVAVEAPIINKIWPEVKAPEERRVVTTVYFESETVPKNGEYLLLNGSGSGRVNHIAFLSQVQPSYAPAGKQLISVNILDTNDVKPDEVLKEIQSWKTVECSDWKFLKSYPIHYAQPDSFWSGKKEIEIEDNLFLAGDFTQTPSIEGAMRAGEVAAKKVLQKS